MSVPHVPELVQRLYRWSKGKGNDFSFGGAQEGGPIKPPTLVSVSEIRKERAERRKEAQDKAKDQAKK